LFGGIVNFSTSGQACRVKDPILIPRSIETCPITFNGPHVYDQWCFSIQRGISIGCVSFENAHFSEEETWLKERLIFCIFQTNMDVRDLISTREAIEIETGIFNSPHTGRMDQLL
jgi:hypothetical protein